MRLLGSIVASALIAAVSGPALAQDFTRELNVTQSNAANAGTQKPGSLKVSVWVDRQDLTYSNGEKVQIFAQANEEAYITVFNVGPKGQVVQLFPNTFQTDNKVAAGKPLVIPAANSNSQIIVSEPFGAELIKVIASNKPVKVIPEQLLEGKGTFLTVTGGVDVLVRNLNAVNNSAPADLKVALMNKVIKTKAGKGTQDVAVTVVTPAPAPTAAPAAAPAAPEAAPSAAPAAAPPATPAAPAAAPVAPVITAAAPPAQPAILPVVPAGQVLVVPQPQQPFPLLLAVDKQNYRAGEKVIMAVTSLQACKLTILHVGVSGTARVIFPNKIVKNNAVGAMQTVLVSGGPSPVTFEVSGPTGVEQIIALCSTDASEPITGPLDQEQVFALLGSRESIARDLSAVATKPPGTMAVSTLTYSIVQ